MKCFSKNRIIPVAIILLVFYTISANDRYLTILKEELNREMEILALQNPPVYHINYRVDHYKIWNITANFGNIIAINNDEYSILTTNIRVGNETFDNTHLIKGEADKVRQNAEIIPHDTNVMAIKQYIWKTTDDVYRKSRAEYFTKKNKISVEDTEKYNDYSLGKGEKYFEPEYDCDFSNKIKNRIREAVILASNEFPRNSEIMEGSVDFYFLIQRKYFVSTEGHEIAQNHMQSQIFIKGSIRSPEGGPIRLIQGFTAFIPEDLPDKDTLITSAKSIVEKLIKLKNAPLAEPYSGPAILSPRASGVFFHEILGHRVEGHRLKDETDAHTFKLKIDKSVLPKSMNVVFNPTMKEYEGKSLIGYYKYDDEGTEAQKVNIIEKGILKDFLMGNTPVYGYPESNGHGRAQSGLSPVSRQSNMIIFTTKPYTEEELRKMLIKECKKQGKKYGYYFKDVIGGFTLNKRYIPNAFNVTPTEVYRIYIDEREDELVRGVKLIGTPLAMFSSIKVAGNQYEIFNGMCGASSGRVPVSAVSPAIYVSKIETQKDNQYYSTGPVLESPKGQDNEY